MFVSTAEKPRPAPRCAPSFATAHWTSIAGTGRRTESPARTSRILPGLRKRWPSSRSCFSCSEKWLTRCPLHTATSARCATARISPHPRPPVVSGSLRPTSRPVLSGPSGCSGVASISVSEGKPDRLPRPNCGPQTVRSPVRRAFDQVQSAFSAFAWTRARNYQCASSRARRSSVYAGRRDRLFAGAQQTLHRRRQSHRRRLVRDSTRP